MVQSYVFFFFFKYREKYTYKMWYNDIIKESDDIVATDMNE